MTPKNTACYLALEALESGEPITAEIIHAIHDWLYGLAKVTGRDVPSDANLAARRIESGRIEPGDPEKIREALSLLEGELHRANGERPLFEAC